MLKKGDSKGAQFAGKKISFASENQHSAFLARSDTNELVQFQKQARSLRKEIVKLTICICIN